MLFRINIGLNGSCRRRSGTVLRHEFVVAVDYLPDVSESASTIMPYTPCDVLQSSIVIVSFDTCRSGADGCGVERGRSAGALYSCRGSISATVGVSWVSVELPDG
jgi:hypothetical protein